MGKYMKKSKLTGAIAAIEVSPQSSPLLRTRAAKTLALQRLNKSSALSNPRLVSSSSFLQLRNRRLEKPPIFRPPQKAVEDGGSCGGGLNLDCSLTDSSMKREFAESVSEMRKFDVETESGIVRDFEECFGENFLEFGGEHCGSAGEIHRSSVKNSSTNKISQTNSHTTNSRGEMELLKSIPTANEIEEFFAREELWHQRTFVQKYNFDFSSEIPLQGRYEWVQTVP